MELPVSPPVEPDARQERARDPHRTRADLRAEPAASRVNLLAEQTPAEVIAFDLLALADESLLEQPYQQRRERLAAALAHVRPPVHRTPVTADPAVAARWFEVFDGAGLDGLIAKPPDIPYELHRGPPPGAAGRTRALPDGGVGRAPLGRLAGAG